MLDTLFGNRAHRNSHHCYGFFTTSRCASCAKRRVSFFWDVVYLYQCFPERVYGHFVLEDTLQCVIHLGHAAGHLVHGAPEVANGTLHYASTED